MLIPMELSGLVFIAFDSGINYVQIIHLIDYMHLHRGNYDFFMDVGILF